jgi:hypothetical protein
MSWEYPKYKRLRTYYEDGTYTNPNVDDIKIDVKVLGEIILTETGNLYFVNRNITSISINTPDRLHPKEGLNEWVTLDQIKYILGNEDYPYITEDNNWIVYGFMTNHFLEFLEKEFKKFYRSYKLSKLIKNV